MFIEEQAKVDKRKFKRIPFKDSVNFKLKNSSQFGGCLAHDISEGGIRVNFNDFVPIKSEMVIHMKLRNTAKIIDLNGRVVWQNRVAYSDRYQVGLEFVNLDPVSENEILTYINTHRM